MMRPWYRQACPSPDPAAITAALDRQAKLTKPAGALGQLEMLAIQLAGLQATALPQVDKVWISVFAADHGVAAAGVSAYPQAVTGEMLRNFAAGGAAINVLAKQLDAHLEVIDLGVVNDPGSLPGVLRQRLAAATADFSQAPAMSLEQLSDALQVGRAAAVRAAADGAQLLIGGEMGIGNTAAAAALGCALLGVPAERLTGRGTGVDAAGLVRKTQVIQHALDLHAGTHSPEELLRRFAGFEMVALAGCYIAAAQAGIAVLVDGFVCTAAALAAVRIQPSLRPWLLFAHQSQEIGHRHLLAALEATPLIDLGMRLGEASGAAVALPLVRLACALHAQMATFTEAGVSTA